jgi:hypothetical protein
MVPSFGESGLSVFSPGPVHEQCRRLLDANKDLEEKQQALEKRMTEQTVARAQVGFELKVKIDKLMAENTRLRKILVADRKDIVETQGEKSHGGEQSKKRLRDEQACVEEKAKKRRHDEPALTYQQKKEIGEGMAKLDGQELEDVIKMICKEIPQIEQVSCCFFSFADYDVQNLSI